MPSGESGSPSDQTIRKIVRAVEAEATPVKTVVLDASLVEELGMSSRKGRYLDLLSSEQRKEHPMYSGFKAYFPDAIALVSHLSWAGNEKHNPGQPLHHARGKSNDHQDCIERHAATADEYDVIVLSDGSERSIPHRVAVAWRAMADLQEWAEREWNLSLPPGAREYVDAE